MTGPNSKIGIIVNLLYFLLCCDICQINTLKSQRMSRKYNRPNTVAAPHSRTGIAWAIMLCCAILTLTGCKAIPIYHPNTDKEADARYEAGRCAIAGITDIRVQNKNSEPNFDSKLDPFNFSLKENIEQRIADVRSVLQDTKKYGDAASSSISHNCLGQKNALLIRYSIGDEQFFLQRQVFAARQRVKLHCEYELLRSDDLTVIREGNVDRILSYLVPISAYASVLSKEDVLYESIGDLVDEMINKMSNTID